MFPTYYDELKDLVPEVYFGGEEVPPYLHAEVGPSRSIEDIIATIRSIGAGTNCSGYIDHEGIHYHLPIEETIRVDLSKKFVIVSQPRSVDGHRVSSWQVFKFLQEPALEALFIGYYGATHLRKTAGTMALCKQLDELWSSESIFLETMIEMAESPEALEHGLAQLMKTYEGAAFGSSSEMWEFWDTFGEQLMSERLKLSVTVYPESDEEIL